MNEQSSQVCVTAFRNAAEPVLAAGGVLLGGEPQPCRELPTAREVTGIADGGDDSQCAQGADAADLHQALCRLTQAGLRFELAVIAGDAFIKPAQMLMQVIDGLTRQHRKVSGSLQRLGAEDRRALGYDDAELGEQAANAVADGKVVLPKQATGAL